MVYHHLREGVFTNCKHLVLVSSDGARQYFLLLLASVWWCLPVTYFYCQLVYNKQCQRHDGVV
jgi:hypothetical protein